MYEIIAILALVTVGAFWFYRKGKQSAKHETAKQVIKNIKKGNEAARAVDDPVKRKRLRDKWN